MDTQSPTAIGIIPQGLSCSLPEDEVGDWKETDELSHVQKIRNCTHYLEQGKKEAIAALHLMESICRDLKNKSEANNELTEENTALKQQLEKEKSEKSMIVESLNELERQVALLNEKLHASEAHNRTLTQQLQEVTEENAALKSQIQQEQVEKHALAKELTRKTSEMQKMQSHTDSLEGRYSLLTEEKRKLDRQAANLSEDLRARDVHVRSLTKQLKEADGLAQKVAYLLSREKAFELDAKHKEMLRKAAEDSYNTQLSISGKLTNEKMALQNNRNELRESLERANATISDVASQLECMKRTVAELKAKEEKLQHLLLEKDKKMSEQQQACDAEIRRMTGEIATLKEQLEMKKLEKHKLAEELKEREGELHKIQIHAESLEGRCALLTEKQRALTENSTQLSTSLAQANEAMSAVQSELDKLKEKEKEKEKKLTEYDVQFGAVQEQNMQLSESLESANARYSAVESQLKKLKGEATDQKAVKDVLQCLLREKDREVMELEQRLQGIAAFASTPRRANLAESAGQQARYNLRSQNETDDSAGVFAMSLPNDELQNMSTSDH